MPAREIESLYFVMAFVEGLIELACSVPVSEIVLSTYLSGFGCCYPHHFPEFILLTSSCYQVGLLTP